MIQINDRGLFRFVRTLNFRKLIITFVRYVKGIFLYFKYYNQRYFLFSSDIIGKSEVIHSGVFSCTVALKFAVITFIYFTILCYQFLIKRHMYFYKFSDLCSTLNCHHMCINTASEPRCLCSEGFDLDNDGKTCTGVFINLISYST